MNISNWYKQVVSLTPIFGALTGLSVSPETPLWGHLFVLSVVIYTTWQAAKDTRLSEVEIFLMQCQKKQDKGWMFLSVLGLFIASENFALLWVSGDIYAFTQDSSMAMILIMVGIIFGVHGYLRSMRFLLHIQQPNI